MVVYNDTSQEWYNVSSTGFSYYGAAVGGAAQFVPSFGPAGLLLVFGGTTVNGQYVPYNNVYMYEPLSQQWQTQKATGDLPNQATNFCVVGVEGDDDTYEVWRPHLP